MSRPNLWGAISIQRTIVVEFQFAPHTFRECQSQVVRATPGFQSHKGSVWRPSSVSRRWPMYPRRSAKRQASAAIGSAADMPSRRSSSSTCPYSNPTSPRHSGQAVSHRQRCVRGRRRLTQRFSVGARAHVDLGWGRIPVGAWSRQWGVRSTEESDRDSAARSPLSSGPFRQPVDGAGHHEGASGVLGRSPDGTTTRPIAGCSGGVPANKPPTAPRISRRIGTNDSICLSLFREHQHHSLWVSGHFRE